MLRVIFIKILFVKEESLKLPGQMNLNVKRKFHNGLFFNTSKNNTYSRSSKVLPDWNFLKIFDCQHIAGVEIQSMSLPASTNIFNTFMHTLVSVNMTHLSRKCFFKF